MEKTQSKNPAAGSAPPAGAGLQNSFMDRIGRMVRSMSQRELPEVRPFTPAELAGLRRTQAAQAAAEIAGRTAIAAEQSRRSQLEYLYREGLVDERWRFDSPSLIEDDKNAGALQSAKVFARRDMGTMVSGPQLLLVCGGHGSGKSVLVSCVVHARLAAAGSGETVWIASARRLGDIYSSFSRSDDDGRLEAERRRLEDSSLLVLDNLGSDGRAMNQFEQQVTGDLIRERRRRGLDTLITTTLNAGQGGMMLQSAGAVQTVLKKMVGEYCFESLYCYESMVVALLAGRSRRTGS